MFKHYGGAKLASNYKKKSGKTGGENNGKRKQKETRKKGKREKKNNGKGGKQDIIISIAILDLSVSLITIQPNISSYLYTENLECSKYLLRC